MIKPTSFVDIKNPKIIFVPLWLKIAFDILIKKLRRKKRDGFVQFKSSKMAHVLVD